MMTREQVERLRTALAVRVGINIADVHALIDLAGRWLAWEECDAEAREHCIRQLASVRGNHNMPARDAALALLTADRATDTGDAK